MTILRTFDLADQRRFADLSRDWNPLHVDAVAARRTIAGEPVVHGMHLLAWSLEEYWRSAGAARGAEALTATFLKPVTLGHEVSLSFTPLDDGAVWLQIDRAGVAHMTARLVPGGIVRSAAVPSAARPAAMATTPVPRDWEFAALKNAHGTTPVETDPEPLTRLFPRCCEHLGGAATAAILALSRLVGMEMPGLHSLFAAVELTLSDDLAPRIEWRVKRHSVRQAPLVVAVSGSGVEGTVTAFMRPAPIAQPGMQQVRAAVPAGSFAGQRALVIGGSRGLGELVAKIVTAGGGAAHITYLSGVDDAGRVAAEIRAAGGVCSLQRFDAQSIDSAEIAALLRADPTHIYYFATPRIAAGQGADEDSLQRYRRVYVETFAELCRALDGREVSVLYPSSVFVDEKPAGFADYVAAKSEGESLCARLNEQQRSLHVMCVRLPRLKTDQTAGLLARGIAEPLPVLRDLVQRFHDFRKGERA